VIDATFRPLQTWPHPNTSAWHRRSSSTFKAPWSDTLFKLDSEIRKLGGRSVIIAAGFQPRDLRLDGWPRSDARTPFHPGVEISFDSKHGRLIYATDVCAYWQHNVRSIALGLEALRKVDLYGVSRRGEQYAGWKELPSGVGRGVVIANVSEARHILVEEAGLDGDSTRYTADDLFRMASKKTHPDTGGTDEAFIRVRAAFELLKAAS
jgi:hypothetical protein